MGDRRDSSYLSGCDLSRRGIHASEGYVSSRETGLHAVVHLLHVEKYQAGNNGAFYRAHADAGAGIFPHEPLAQHSGYLARIFANRRPPRIYHTFDSGRDLGRKLRYLWTRLRAAGEPAFDAGQRGISRIRKISNSRVGP